MVTVTLCKCGDEIIGFDCSGHAGQAPEGENIVCAAISVLTTTCANALETVAGLKVDAEAESGRMRVRIAPHSGETAQVLFRFMLQGLRDIAAEYPGSLRLKQH